MSESQHIPLITASPNFFESLRDFKAEILKSGKHYASGVISGIVLTSLVLLFQKLGVSDEYTFNHSAKEFLDHYHDFPVQIFLLSMALSGVFMLLRKTPGKFLMTIFVQPINAFLFHTNAIVTGSSFVLVCLSSEHLGPNQNWPILAGISALSIIFPTTQYFFDKAGIEMLKELKDNRITIERYNFGENVMTGAGAVLLFLGAGSLWLTRLA